MSKTDYKCSIAKLIFFTLSDAKIFLLKTTQKSLLNTEYSLKAYI